MENQRIQNKQQYNDVKLCIKCVACSDICHVKLGSPDLSASDSLTIQIYVKDIGNHVPDENVNLFEDNINLFAINCATRYLNLSVK